MSLVGNTERYLTLHLVVSVASLEGTRFCSQFCVFTFSIGSTYTADVLEFLGRLLYHLVQTNCATWLRVII
jgi:hypothetical protein